MKSAYNAGAAENAQRDVQAQIEKSQKIINREQEKINQLRNKMNGYINKANKYANKANVSFGKEDNKNYHVNALGLSKNASAQDRLNLAKNPKFKQWQRDNGLK